MPQTHTSNFSTALLSILQIQTRFSFQILYSSYDTPFRHPPLNQIGHGTVHPHDFKLKLSWWEQHTNEKLQLPGAAWEGDSDSWRLQSFPVLLQLHHKGHFQVLPRLFCVLRPLLRDHSLLWAGMNPHRSKPNSWRRSSCETSSERWMSPEDENTVSQNRKQTPVNALLSTSFMVLSACFDFLFLCGWELD